MIRYVMVFALILLGCAPLARAADINAEGATHLKAVFTQLLSEQQALAKAAQGRKFQYEGEITVEPAGTYYAITLPHASMLYPDGSRLEIGMVSINAAPGDAQGQWKMSVALPTPMTLYNETGAVVREVHIGAQRAAGLWHEDLYNFSKFEARYQNITIDDHEKGYSLLIPQAAILYDLTQNKDQTWSGPVDFQLSDIQADFEKTGAAMTIKNARAHMEVQSFDRAATRDYKVKMLSMMGDNANGAPPAQSQYNLLFDALLHLVDGFSVQYDISDITFSQPATAGAPAYNAHADDIKAGVGISGIAKNRANLNLQLGLSGAQTSAPNSLLPRDGNIAINVNNIPFKELTALGQNTLQASLQQPEMAQVAGLMLISKLPAILSQSGATLSIPNNFISNESYRINLNGAAQANASAVNSFTAKAHMSIIGLDWLMDALQQQPDKTKNALSSQLQAFKSHARVEAAPDDKPMHVVDFEMTKDGQVLLNGQPPAPTAAPVTPPSANTVQPH